MDKYIELYLKIYNKLSELKKEKKFSFTFEPQKTADVILMELGKDSRTPMKKRKPSKNQLAFLKKHKINYSPSITFQEAWALINEFIESRR